ncbi:MAG: guanylate kinase [Eubacteriales bacterium]
MGKIFCIMGKSSTGKDTIYNNLINSYSLKLKPIIPYTTRPMREGEENGREYFFVNDEQLEELEKKESIIELREYQTYHGVWRYFTVNDEQIDLENNDYLMIGTIESYVSIAKYFGEQIVIPILIEVEDGKRLKRAVEREMAQDQPKYEELCRRFLADGVDFSDEKKREAGIVKTFQNQDLQDCLEEVKKYIMMLV